MLPQWSQGNSCTWAHNVRLQLQALSKLKKQSENAFRKTSVEMFIKRRYLHEIIMHPWLKSYQYQVHISTGYRMIVSGVNDKFDEW